MSKFYWNGISLPETLSESEQISLFKELKAGNQEARNRLVEGNLRLVANISNKTNPSLFEDLFQVGCLGLMKAIDGYILEKNIKFSTYAYRCIQNEILMDIKKSKKLSQEVSYEEILKTTSGLESSFTILDTLFDPSKNILENYIEVEEIQYEKVLIEKILSCLPENRDKQILLSYFGLIGGKRCSQKDLSEKFGISQSYASRIVKKGVETIKRNLNKYENEIYNNSNQKEENIIMNTGTDRTIYTYFSNYSCDIIDTAYQSINDKELKTNFIKKWGPYLDGTNKKYQYTINDQKNFNNYENQFLERLKQVSLLVQSEYKGEEIIVALREGKTLEIKEKINKKILPTYKNISEIASHFHTTETLLKEVMEELPMKEKLCYQYYYGIDRKKMKIKEISLLLKLSEHLTKSYIWTVEEKLPKCIEKKEDEKSAKRGRKLKEKFLDYFDKKRECEVLRILEVYASIQDPAYFTIVKIYGPDYKYLDRGYQLSQEETYKKNVLICEIRKFLQLLEKGKSIDEICEEILEKKSCYLKENFLDYFELGQKEQVIEILLKYGRNEPYEYAVLIKYYGENYNNFNYKMVITKEDKQIIQSIKTNIKQQLKKMGSLVPVHRKRQMPISFIEYFVESDREQVIEILLKYGSKKPQKYAILVKCYGEKYDRRNDEIVITKEDKQIIQSIKMNIKQQLERIRLGKKVVKYSKEDIFDKQNIVKTSSNKIEAKNKKLNELEQLLPYLSGQEQLILTAKYKRQMDIDQIAAVFRLSPAIIECCLLQHLNLFGLERSNIFMSIVKRNNLTIQQIIDSSFLKNEIMLLTSREQMYLYLKLESFRNPLWTDEQIASYLDCNVSYLNEYKIMTSSDQLNELNYLLKK